MPDLNVLDLEDRLTRHYTDVATAPSLHRRSSTAPRLAFAGLVVALIAGAAYVSGIGSTGEDIIAGPGPDTEVEAGIIDPELLRLLERAPYLEERGGFGYLDVEVARRGEIEQNVAEDGETIDFPLAFDWGPGIITEVTSSYRYPSAYEEAFGYGFSDIDRVLNIGFGGSSFTNTFVVIDGDAAAAVDRATAPEWAAQDTRTQDGPFDIRNWGDRDDEVQQTQSSEVRPLGQAGQLTAFDGNVTLQSASTEILDAVLATENGAPTLADQGQLMKGLERIDYNDSLGMFAQIAPEGRLSTFDAAEGTVAGPTLWIVETGLDGSSRVVLGFLPGTDAASVEEGLRAAISPIVDVSQFGVGTEALKETTITRSEEFVVIDFVPTDPTARFGQNGEVRDFVSKLLFDNPDILS